MAFEHARRTGSVNMISWSVIRNRYPMSILTAAIVLIFGSLLIGYQGLRDPAARAHNGSVWFVDLNHGVPIKIPLGTDSPTDLSAGTQPAVHLLAFTCASNPPNDKWLGYLEAHGHLAFPSSPPHRSQTGAPGGGLVRSRAACQRPSTAGGPISSQSQRATAMVRRQQH